MLPEDIHHDSLLVIFCGIEGCLRRSSGVLYFETVSERGEQEQEFRGATLLSRVEGKSGTGGRLYDGL
jgi:hypothetical protein